MCDVIFGSGAEYKVQSTHMDFAEKQLLKYGWSRGSLVDLLVCAVD